MKHNPKSNIQSSAPDFFSFMNNFNTGIRMMEGYANKKDCIK